MVVTMSNSQIRAAASAAAKPQMKFLVIAYFFLGALNQAGQIFNMKNPAEDAWLQVLLTGVASLVLVFCISAWLSKGYANANLMIIDGVKASSNDLFIGIKDFWRSFVAVILIFIKTLLWFCLFIFPALIAYFKYILTFYVMNERPDLSGAQCIQESCRLMKGNKQRLFKMLIIYMAFSALVAIVGYLLFWGLFSLVAPASAAQDAASAISVFIAGIVYGVKANPTIAKFYRLVSAEA